MPSTGVEARSAELAINNLIHDIACRNAFQPVLPIHYCCGRFKQLLKPFTSVRGGVSRPLDFARCWTTVAPLSWPFWSLEPPSRRVLLPLAKVQQHSCPSLEYTIMS